MTPLELRLISIAIALLYIALWGTAAQSKWSSLKTPDWFLKQFEKTFFTKLPGGIAASYWGIAVLELALALLFTASLFSASLLPLALIGSLFVFAALIVGLRITFDFQGSANMYTYFAATLLCLWFLEAHPGARF